MSTWKAPVCVGGCHQALEAGTQRQARRPDDVQQHLQNVGKVLDAEHAAKVHQAAQRRRKKRELFSGVCLADGRPCRQAAAVRREEARLARINRLPDRRCQKLQSTAMLQSVRGRERAATAKRKQ